MDLFDLFDKYNQGTLTERDILLAEYDGHRESFRKFFEKEEEEDKEVKITKVRRKSRDHHQIVKQRSYR
jgi:hypothetical protein